MSEMLEGVKLILERMKTNPEEFERNGKFNWIRSGMVSAREQKKPLYPLSKEETELVLQGLVEIDREAFNVKVFDCLMKEGLREAEQLELPYATTFTGSIPISTGQNYISNKIQIGKQSISEQDIEKIKEVISTRWVI